MQQKFHFESPEDMQGSVSFGGQARCLNQTVKGTCAFRMSLEPYAASKQVVLLQTKAE